MAKKERGYTKSMRDEFWLRSQNFHDASDMCMGFEEENEAHMIHSVGMVEIKSNRPINIYGAFPH